MAKGHPDFGTWAGIALGGEEVQNYYINKTIDAEGSTTITLPAVPAGYEYIYQFLIVSTDHDDHLSDIILYRVSDMLYFSGGVFALNMSLNVGGFPVAAGEQVVIHIDNYGSAEAQYVGGLFWVKKKI